MTVEHFFKYEEREKMKGRRFLEPKIRVFMSKRLYVV
jgi:hypothetical protein